MSNPRPDQPLDPGTDELLKLALAAARGGQEELEAALDDLSAPIYTTDGRGWVTFFNKACVDFAGRIPIAGADRWCISWKLYTADGTPLPHDRCPLAEAIRQKREIRGITAMAERPDGTRVAFRPYPTPLFDEDGEVTGAVNILIDITDRRQAEYLRGQAEWCRRLARSVSDMKTLETLSLMADEYEEKARNLAQLN